MLLVLALLGGTAAAFAVTEGLKLERSPIAATKVDKVFSPVCGCPRDHAGIAFRLRRGDDVTVAIVDSGGHVVRTLLRNASRRRGLHRLVWDGRGDNGIVVADGSYKPRVHFRKAHRTILLPNPIKLDTAAPRPTLDGVAPTAFSPDGDGRRDHVVVRYRFGESARALLYVNGILRVRVKQFRTSGSLTWYGLADLVPMPAGTYVLTLAGEDRAGNVSRAVGQEVVRIRYVELRPRVLRVREATRFGVKVSTDAVRYRWRLGKRHGTSGRRVLVLRAGYPGRYRLVVTANGHAARAIVIVERRP